MCFATERVKCMFVFTCFVRDIDWSAGCGAVSSTSHSIDSDSVVGTRLQVRDCGSGLRARHCELLGITVTSWMKIGKVIYMLKKPILCFKNQKRVLQKLQNQ